MAKRFKRKLTVDDGSKKELLRDVKKQVAEANRRLERLERGYDINKATYNLKTGRFERKSSEVKRVTFEQGTWASKKLIDRLDSGTIDAYSKGKIKVSEKMSVTQLKAVQKATSQFLSSRTSTISGIKKVKESTLETLKESLSDEVLGDVSDEEVETLYGMLGDDDFRFLSDKLGASTSWAIIEDAKEDNDTEKGFINRLNKYAFEINDVDMRNKALKIYEKYVRR